MILLHFVLTNLLNLFVSVAASQQDQLVAPTSDQDLLLKLGLPGPPKSVHEHKITEISAFMMELYKQHEVPRIATSVVSYPALQQKEHHIGGNRWQFSFKISQIPLSHKVTQAALRIYKVKGSKQKETPYIVSIFHSVKKEDVSSRKHYYNSSYDPALAVRLLDSKNNIESKQSHWCKFNITDAVRVVQSLGQDTIDLEIVSTPANPIDKSPSSRGIRFTKSRGKQPSIVIYTDDGSRAQKNDERLVRGSGTDHNMNIHDPTKTFCRRKDLFIDFSRLGWDWIIGPRGFDAYMCSGECPLSFSSKLKITNHALLQAFMGTKHRDIPMPCCSPTKLSPITLIYYANNNGITMTEYEEMMVEQCGCE